MHVESLEHAAQHPSQQRLARQLACVHVVLVETATGSHTRFDPTHLIADKASRL